MFVLALVVGLISLGLLIVEPAAGIIGLILAVGLVITNSQRNRQRRDQQRHDELMAAMRKRDE